MTTVITLGVPLQNIGRNYLCELGRYVDRGIQFVTGVHYGRVTSLREDLKENQRFEMPSANFQVSDATFTLSRFSGYIGVTAVRLMNVGQDTLSRER